LARYAIIKRYVVERLTPSSQGDRFPVDDCESLVAVPLQQAADRFFAPAALLPSLPRLAVFRNVFAGHRHPPIWSKRWAAKFSG
jgi:hypothetical protein